MPFIYFKGFLLIHMPPPAPPLPMVPLCNRWWDHVGCKWSQVATNHMLRTSSLWNVRTLGRRCDAKNNGKKCIHCESPKIQKLVITLWWGASIGSYANLAITRNGDGERWDSEIEANCKENPNFLAKFPIFFSLYMIHIPPLDFAFEQNFTQKNMDSKVYLKQNIHLKY